MTKHEDLRVNAVIEVLQTFDIRALDGTRPTLGGLNLLAHQILAKSDALLPVEWVWEADDPDSSFGSPIEALTCIRSRGPLLIKGGMETFEKWGVLLPAEPDADNDDEQDFWFDTEEEAQTFCDEQKAKLQQMEDGHD